MIDRAILFLRRVLATWRGRAALAAAPLSLIAIAAFSNHAIEDAARGKMYSRVEDVPAHDVALVFGASPSTPRGSNPYFDGRIQAAAALWKAGKVKRILASGDNSTRRYDEPTAMKKALVVAGVPESAITLDYAGFRTLDSTVRSKWVFGQESIVLVSQRFQSVRALFIARHFGIDAIAFNADEVQTKFYSGIRLREQMARIKAMLDVYVLHVGPRFPGPPEPIRV